MGSYKEYYRVTKSMRVYGGMNYQTRANSLGQGQETLLSTLTTTKEHIFGCC